MVILMVLPNCDNNGNLPEHDDFYRPTLNEFVARFVNIENRARREALYKKYEKYCKRFTKILFKVWIDGSYTTTKPKPGDVDLTVHYDALKIEDLRNIHITERKYFFDKKYIHKTYECHTQYVPVYPKSDLRYALTEIQQDKWKKHFTKDRQGNRKGLIEMSLSQ